MKIHSLLALCVVVLFNTSTVQGYPRASDLHRYENGLLMDDEEAAHPHTVKEWFRSRENRKKVWYFLCITGIACLVYYYGPHMWAWLGTKTGFIEWWENSHVNFLGNTLRGKEWLYTTKDGRRVRIRQLHVKSQFDSDGGGSASCGYGALYWVQRIKRSLDTKKTLTQYDMYDSLSIGLSHGPKGYRRKYIVDQRVKKTNPRIIKSNEEIKRWNASVPHQNEEIEKRNAIIQAQNPLLAEKFRQSLISLKAKQPLQDTLDSQGDWLTGHELCKQIEYEGLAEDYTVFDDYQMIGREGIETSTQRCRLAWHTKKPYAHCFIIGTMEHDRDGSWGIARDRGHFFGVVYHVDEKGESVYTIADTANCLREGDRRLQRLINYIDGARE